MKAKTPNPAKFYITTPIYYVNARPHIGHAYTTIVCDAIARRQRLLGKEVFFLTGTDEHGVKVERSANAAGKTPQKFADDVAAEFRGLFERMGITFDKFIRTTSDEHKRGAQELWRQLEKNGHIYKGKYTGQYCVFDELYVDAAKPGDPCPECGRPTETVSEENYYFKLSAFAAPLLKHFEEHPEFIYPESRRNEVISFVKGGLRDLSVSRSTFKWGVPVPSNPAHVMYVWLDALSNYITALGYGSPEKPDQERYQRFWPADAQMIGKEIVRFHCVYWPAFLMAAGIPLPRQIVAHGWLLFEESKMSKSRGNIVRAETIIDVLGNDALRYFLMREIVFGQDGSFSFDALVQRYNSDLANGLGNLASRAMAMIHKYFNGEVPYPSKTVAHTPAESAIAKLAEEVIATATAQFEDFQFSRALETIWTLIAAVDKYIVESQPWGLGDKTDEESRARLATILYSSAEALRIVTLLAHPVLPDATAKIWRLLGLGEIRDTNLKDLKWGGLNVSTKLQATEPVFPRADKAVIERMQRMEETRNPSTSSTATDGAAPNATPNATQAPSAASPPASQPSSTPAGTGAQAGQPATQAAGAAVPVAVPADAKISIDDFTKIELRVAQIVVAEKVKGADKLLRLEVDLGYEKRQILAGIAEAYAPEMLVGRKVVIVANLAPRKMRGLESNGMLVAASLEDGKPVLASFLEEVPLGARLK